MKIWGISIGRRESPRSVLEQRTMGQPDRFDVAIQKALEGSSEERPAQFAAISEAMHRGKRDTVLFDANAPVSNGCPDLMQFEYDA